MAELKNSTVTPKVTVKVLFIDDMENVSKKVDKPFDKQEFGVEIIEEINDTEYSKTYKISAGNEKCKLLENINVGDVVDIKYNIIGFVTKKDEKKKIATKNPKHIGVIMNLNLIDLKVISKATASSTTTSGVKPDVIPDGMEWDEEKKILVEKVPF